MRNKFVLFFVASFAALAQTTINGSRTILGTWDASGAARTAPAKAGTSLPGTCTVGDVYFKTDATAGQNLYYCTATNTWTQQLNSGGGGGGAAPEFGSYSTITGTTCASASDKRLGFPTSGSIGVGLVCDGSSWKTTLYGRVLAAPAADPGTAWNNTGCTTDATNGIVSFECTGNSMHGRMQTVSTSGNWAYAVAYAFYAAQSDTVAGVYARNSSGDIFRGAGTGQHTSTTAFQIRGLSGTGTSTNAQNHTGVTTQGQVRFACIGDTGSTMTAYYSVDGSHWVSRDTALRSTLSSGADQVGIAINPADASLAASMVVFAARLTTSSATCPTL